MNYRYVHAQDPEEECAAGQNRGREPGARLTAEAIGSNGEAVAPVARFCQPGSAVRGSGAGDAAHHPRTRPASPAGRCHRVVGAVLGASAFLFASGGAALAQNLSPIYITLTADTTTISEPTSGAKHEETVTITATIPDGQPAPGSTISQALQFRSGFPGAAKRGTQLSVGDYQLVGAAGFLTIPAGKHVGTLSLRIQTVDDNFWERDEIIRIGASGTGRYQFKDFDITLKDQDAKPSVSLWVTGGGAVPEGQTVKRTIQATLPDSESLVEAPITITVQPDPTQKLVHNTDISYSPAPPWTVVIPASSRNGEKAIQVTLPEDDIPEDSQTIYLTGKSSVFGENLVVKRTGQLFTDITDKVGVRVDVQTLRTLRSGKSHEVTIQVTAYNGVIPASGMTVNVVPGRFADWFTPDKLSFSWPAGKNCLTGGCKKTAKFTVDAPPQVANVVLRFKATVPDLKAEEWYFRSTTQNTLEFSAAPSPLAVVTPLHLRPHTLPPGSQPYEADEELRFRAKFNNPVRLTGTATLRIYLDSGPVDVPCALVPNSPTELECIYTVARRHYDFDKVLEIREGALDLGGRVQHRNEPDTDWDPLTMPAKALSVSLQRPVYGSGHAFEATPTVQEGFREGAGRQEVEVLVSDVGSRPVARDITIPITILNGTTNSADWILRGAGSVTIPKGAYEANGSVWIEALLDGINEDDETLLVGGDSDAYPIKPGELVLLDSPELILTATPTQLHEGQTTSVTVKVEIEETAAVFTDPKSIILGLRGQARRGQDYVASWTVVGSTGRATANPVLTIKKGERSAEIVIDFDVKDDNLVEGPENLTIIGRSGALTVRSTDLEIADNDNTAEVELTVTPTTVTEGGGAQNVQVSAALVNNTAQAQDVLVTLEVSGEANAEPPATQFDDAQDYTASWAPTTRQITIPAGQTSGSARVTLTVTPVDDAQEEGSETIIVQGTAVRQDSGNTELRVQPAEVELEDNDTRGVDVSPTSLALEAGVSGTYRVRLRSQPNLRNNEKVRIDVNLPDRAPLTVSQDAVEFDASDWSSWKTVTVTANANAESEEVTISHEAGGGDYINVDVDPVEVSISDAPDLTVVLDNSSITENGGVATASATLRAASAETITVTLSVDPDDPATESDYTLSASPVLTFAPGATTATGTVTITAVDNNIDTPDKTVQVQAAVDHGGIPNPAALSLTIVDDDDAPSSLTLTVDADTGTEGPQTTVTEDGGAKTALVTATLDGATRFAAEKTVTVTVGVAEDTATKGTDYGEVADQSITIVAGAASGNVEFTLTPENDVLHEPTESLTLTGELSGLTVAPAAISISDDDAVPTALTLSVDADTGTEGPQTTVTEDGGAKTALVTATLDGATRFAAEKTVTVTVGVAEDTATKGTDYGEVADQSITIVAGAASGNVEFTLTPENDVLHEPTESLTLTGELSGLTVAPATISISDDDAVPTALALSVDADTGTDGTQTSVAEAGGAKTALVTATLDGATRFAEEKTVTVTVGVAEDTARKGTDYGEVADQSITIVAGAASGNVEFTLTPENDVLHEPTESLTLAGELAGVTVAPAAISITDDDAVPTALTLSVDADTGTDGTQTTVAEAGGAKTARVTATLAGATRFAEEKTVTVKVGVAEDTATKVDDYATVADFDITIAVGAATGEAEFTLTPVNDVLHEETETLTLAGELDGVTVAPATISISDDDAIPTALTLSVDTDTTTDAAEDSVAEDGGAKTVRVIATLDGTTRFVGPTTVTVAVGADADSAKEGTDYEEVAEQTINIDAGAGSGHVDFTLTPKDDLLFDEKELISLDGSATDLTVTDTVMYITDDDTAPTSLTLTVDADTTTDAAEDSVAEDGGAKTVRVTATLDQNTRFVDPTTVTLAVGAAGDTAKEGEDYEEVAEQTITIDTGAGSGHVDFTLTPEDDLLFDETELISLDGSATDLTVTDTVMYITDDDTAPTSLTLTVDADTATDAIEDSVAEDGGAKTVRVTATLDQNTRFVDATTVTVAVGAAGDSATEGEDYSEVAEQTITIPRGVGSAHAEFTLTPTSDVLAESDERISLDGTADGLTVNNTKMYITDNDDEPTSLTLKVDTDTGTQGDQGSVAEGGGAKTVRVTATLDQNTRFTSAKTVTVAIGNAADSATEGEDYTTVAGLSILIKAGEASGSVDFLLTPTDDNIDDDGEKISVEGESGTLTVAGTEIGITDNDAAPTALTLTVDADTGTQDVQTSVAEGGGVKTVRVTATLDGSTTFRSDSTVTVTVGAAEDSATEGEDYTTVAGLSILIKAGEASGYVDFLLTPTDDNIDDDGEKISVEGESGTLTVAGTEIGITDNDAAPTALTLTVDADTGTPNAQSTVGEGGGAKTVRVTATLDGSTTFRSDSTVTVTVGAAEDSATEGEDYTTVADLSIPIKAGEASGYVDFLLTPTDDNIDDDGETISVEGELGTLTVAGTEIGITDNDAAPTALTLTVDADTGTPDVQSAVAEGGGAKTVRVTATLGGSTTFRSDSTVTVTVGADSDSATEGEDYNTVAELSILIKAGAAAGYTDFTLTPTNDVLDEKDEAISVDGELGTLAVTGTQIDLTDDDATPTSLTLSVDADTGAENVQTTVAEEGGTKTVRVTATVDGNSRFVDPTTVTVEVGTAGDSATEGTDYTDVADQTITIAAGAASGSKDFTLTPTSDDLAEGSERIGLDGSATDLTVAGAHIDITDDDSPPEILTLSVDADTGTQDVQSTIAEGGGAKMVRVTATVEGSSRFVESRTVTVEVGKSADSAEAGTDYTPVADQTITIAAGAASGSKDFTLTPTNDPLVETDERISLDGSADGLTVNDTHLDITDDDVAPTALTLTVDTDTGSQGDQTTIAEDGGAKTVRVTATLVGSGRFVSATEVTVAVGKDADTATEGTDYEEVAEQTITIDAGDGSADVEFTLTPTDDVLAETAERISLEGTASDLTVNGAHIDITDTDAAPTTLTLSVDADTGTNGTQTSTAEDGVARTVRVTGTLGGSTRFSTDKTVTVAVGKDADSATKGADYTAVADQSILLEAGAASGTVEFSLTATDDRLHEGSESISLDGTLSGVAVTGTTIGIDDGDTAPTSLTITVDTDTSDPGLQDSVDEDGGVKTVWVYATLDDDGGDVRFATARTVTVTIGDTGDSAKEGTDYAEVGTLEIVIGAGEPDGSASFSLTPTIDDLYEGEETLSVDGALGTLTVTPAAIRILDGDTAPDKVTFTADKAGVTPTVVNENGGKQTVRVTAAISGTVAYGDDKTITVTVGDAEDSAVEGTDYATVDTLDLVIKAGKASGSVEFDLTPANDTLHEGDETLSVAGAFDGITVPATTITIRDDDAAPSSLAITFDADAGTDGTQDSVGEEGGAKTVRVTATLGGSTQFAEDKTVTIAVGKDGDSAEESKDYTPVADQTITIDAETQSGSVDFTLTPTSDVLHEGKETISLEGALTGITDVTNAEIGITDDDAAPTSLTLTVDADTATDLVQTSVAEDGGAKTVRVTATLDGSTRFPDAKTVTVAVGADEDSAKEGEDYTTVSDLSITIAAGTASGTKDFTLTPANDVLDEPVETISVEGDLDTLTVKGAEIGITDDDETPTKLTLSVDTDPGTQGDQDSVTENGGAKTVRVTAELVGNSRFVSDTTVTVAVGKVGDSAEKGTDYKNVAEQTITIPGRSGSAHVDFTLTPTNDLLVDGKELITLDGSATDLTVTDVVMYITDDDLAPTSLTLTVDADTATDGIQGSVAEDGGAKTVRVTATLDQNTRFVSATTVTVEVGKAADSAREGSDYGAVADQTITIPAGDGSVYKDFTLTPTSDQLAEDDERISLEGTAGDLTVTNTGIDITDNDDEPTSLTLTVDADTGTDLVQTSVAEDGGAKTVRVTATLDQNTRFVSATTVAVTVGKAGDSAREGDDYAKVAEQTITIACGCRQWRGGFHADAAE